MRISRPILLKIVQDTVAKRAKADRGLLSVYLSGSLLGDDFLIGGATDIDLIFIHSDEAPAPREIIALTDDVHLDLGHFLQRDFRQTRRLRVDPWFGPTLKSCEVLYDPQHFLDFTQASVRGQFERADRVMARARPQAEKARQAWIGFHSTNSTDNPGPREISDYLLAVESAVNAIASLSGPPLPERRLVLQFKQRAEAAGHPGLYAGMLGLLGAPKVDPPQVSAWLPAWQQAFMAVPEDRRPINLNLIRRRYYQAAFETFLAGSQPEAALWPLLYTWTQAVERLTAESEELRAWQAALIELGIAGQEFGERLQGLDAYLDMVDEALDEWARANGA